MQIFFFTIENKYKEHYLFFVMNRRHRHNKITLGRRYNERQCNERSIQRALG